MTTPIIMLVLLIAPWMALRLWASRHKTAFDGTAAAAIGVGILFLFTGVGHFVKTESMALMLPEVVPQKVLLVQLSGVLELAIGIALFRPCCRSLAAWIAAILLILFFPLNVYTAINKVPLGGHEWGLSYLWIRGPLQIITLLWIYGFLLRKPAK